MRKKKPLILVLAAVIFVAGSAVSIVVTERPKFCSSCHIMKPYYRSWKESSHKKVNCLECHYEPTIKAHVQGKINGLVQVVQYATHRYSAKPHAQVSDASCLREGCHEKSDLKSKEAKLGNTIDFDHGRHFVNLKGNIQLRCTSCHMQLTSDKHIAIEKSVCFTCHFKDLSAEQLAKQCLRCHTGIKEEKAHKKEYLASGAKCADCHSEPKKGNAQVNRQACYFCHAEKEKIEKIKDYALMHKAHIERNKVDCGSCHGIIEHN